MMTYRFCGNSGLQLPLISLGLWHNFGDVDNFEVASDLICHAFNEGVTHFDLANNYGPSPGSAELNFGKILKNNLLSHRDEMIISSKAGYLMWNGPYGMGGSRKQLMASLNQSLKRTGLDYFDLFYSHRYDPQTPLEETMQALTDMVKQGKALYVGISNYPADKAIEACEYLKKSQTPCLIFQDKYSMLVRNVEQGNLPIAAEQGAGMIAFSPLAQGILTDRYLNGIPTNSRAANPTGFLKTEALTEKVVAMAQSLHQLAQNREQSLAQMALAWSLRDPRMTSVVIGASSVKQLEANLKSIDNLHFSAEELAVIDAILSQNS